MRRGAVTVTPAIELGEDEALTPAKANQLGQPVAQVAQQAIGEEELVADDVRGIVTAMAGLTTVLDRSADHNTAGIYKSSDFVQAVFYDGVGTTGSTNFTSATGIFTNADTGRSMVALGIPPGTTGTYVNANTVTLSQAFTQLFTDGAISGLTTLDSLTAVFTPADNGRTIVGGDLIQAGTTVTYVSPTRVTLSQAALSNGATEFQINGRQVTALEFQVVGRGAGWQLQVDKSGVGRLEAYVGAFGGVIARGAFNVDSTGAVSIGSGTGKLTIDKDGNLTVGTDAATLGITNDGKMWVGAASYDDAIAKFDNTGDFVLGAVAASAHNVATDALNPALQSVAASPPGGAITNPTDVTLTCLTKYSRIYYRLQVKDGVTTSASKTVTSASAPFKATDVGKAITHANIPAGAYIEKWTSATSVDVSIAATASGTVLDLEVTPNNTDTLYVDGVPITFTAARRLTARAYKNGEYSALLSLFFDTATGGTTVPNPSYSPSPGSYGGGDLDVTLRDSLAGSKIRYNKTFSSTGTPADPASPTSASGTLIDLGAAAPTGTVALFKGTTKFKMIAYKTALSDSQVISGTYVVTGGGFGGGGGGGGGEADPS